MTDGDREMMRRRLGASFATGGAAYDRLRPTYPLDAVRWLVPPGAQQAADVGAGTGKLSLLLAQLGLAVVAVDPSADMLAQIPAGVGISTRLGSGEAIGLSSAGVDLVTFGQAWHWVNPHRGPGEVARILRPGGRVGMVWNVLDAETPWVGLFVAAMHAVDERAVEAIHHYEAPVLGPAFGPVERETFGFTVPMTPEAVADLPTTRSYWLSATPERRLAGLGGVEAALAEAPRRPDGLVEVPYVTLAYRATLRSRGAD